ncbi:DsbA family protein [bacterium]|uniref:Thioredoxin domain-containing protein n=2 Tax=Katanobacteria TaxID=422282 RepID=A0A2H0BFD1_UNCKA|nr:DsbA family protein [bacterium]PIP56373.1 MAG: hypothetical protein COX05_03390 [candidate division WWE3 bacterium CG22_combo_CG10-13_8_21_14_all_39_12]
MDQNDIKLAAAVVIGSLVLIAGVVGLAALNDTPDVVDVVDAKGIDRPSKGNPDASIVIVEFSDFQCPACAQAFPTAKTFMETYGEQVNFVYRHFPITQSHPNALSAAYATEAAKQQGLFWEVHDWLFENQTSWATAEVNVDYWFAQFGEDLGFDEDQFKSDYVSDTVRNAVSTDRSDAQQFGVNSTPTFIINGKKLAGSIPLATFIKESGVKEPEPTVVPIDGSSEGSGDTKAPDVTGPNVPEESTSGQ